MGREREHWVDMLVEGDQPNCPPEERDRVPQIAQAVSFGPVRQRKRFRVSRGGGMVVLTRPERTEFTIFHDHRTGKTGVCRGAQPDLPNVGQPSEVRDFFGRMEAARKSGPASKTHWPVDVKSKILPEAA